MHRLTAANQLLCRIGRTLWLNAATVWLVIASVLLVLGYNSLRHEQKKSRGLARQARYLAVQNHRLTLENQARIADIQRSRIASCIKTYQSFHVVLDPFFPPVAKRTPRIKAQFRKFNRIVTQQKASCARRVKP